MNEIFGKKYFTDAQIIDYVNDMNNTTILSVVDPVSGHHYMSPVWPVFYQRKFYISTDDDNMKGKLVSKYHGHKVGLSVIEPNSYPSGRPGTPPYVSISGTAAIRRKSEFNGYREVIDALYDKFNDAFPNQESKQKWIKFVMNESKTRVLLEIVPEKCMIFEKYEEAIAKQKSETQE